LIARVKQLTIASLTVRTAPRNRFTYRFRVVSVMAPAPLAKLPAGPVATRLVAGEKIDQ
jgi:hypothetical protein